MYPEAWAVIDVEPAKYVDVNVVVMYVFPNGIVSVEGTVPTLGSEEKRETVTSPSGSRAGFPAESWSCTCIVLYAWLSAGRTDGLQKTASFAGIGPTVVMVSVSATRSVAAAVMVVLPALYVAEKVAVAYTAPSGTARVACTLPTFSFEDVNWIGMLVEGCLVIFPKSFRS